MCVKERNRIATSNYERERLKAGYGEYEAGNRDKTVRTCLLTIALSIQAPFMMNPISLADMSHDWDRLSPFGMILTGNFIFLITAFLCFENICCVHAFSILIGMISG